MYVMAAIGWVHWVLGAALLLVVLLLAKYLRKAVAWLLVRLYDLFIRDKNHVAPT